MVSYKQYFSQALLVQYIQNYRVQVKAYQVNASGLWKWEDDWEVDGAQTPAEQFYSIAWRRSRSKGWSDWTVVPPVEIVETFQPPGYFIDSISDMTYITMASPDFYLFPGTAYEPFLPFLPTL